MPRSWSPVAEPSPLSRRRRAIAVIAAVACVVMVLGLGASRVIKSPQQVAADASPPAPSVLTARVERRVLKQTVVLRGDVRAGFTYELTPSTTSAGTSIVTSVPLKAGSEAKAGQVVLEVAGRPLFVLPGVKPAYRDLRPGYSGEDVKQLQTALKAIGYDTREYTGYFGQGTKTAIHAFYTSIGFQALPTSADDESRLAAARNKVKLAQRALADAKDADRIAAPDQRASTAKVVQRAADDLADAQSELVNLTKQTGPMLPLGEYAFIASFPARVEGLKAQVGRAIEAPALTLSAGPLRIVAKLTPGQQQAIRPGMAAEIASETLGLTANGSVESVGELETDRENPAASGYPMVITPTSPLDPRLTRQNVQVRVAAAASDGEVLVVPLSALFSGADGQANVVQKEPNGHERRVAVTVGMSGDGYVVITPLDAGLDVGDDVVIGSGSKR